MDNDAPADTRVAKRDPGSARSIGAILIAAGRLNLSHVERILQIGAERGLKFGQAAIELKLLTLEDVEYALAVQFDYPLVPRGVPDGVADDVIAAYSPNSRGVEALRAVRSQLTLRWGEITKRRVLSIVSPERGEGRSWLAANVAALLAQTGMATLLIDADLRHPRQHHLFNLGNVKGLSEVLTGRAGGNAARRIHPQLRLWVLPAGALPPNPQELLSGTVFNFMLDRCTKKFHFVLIDTPATSESADAQIVSARAASALMVVRRNHTRHTGLMTAVENLTRDGVNVVGTVVNEH
jgi:protein-tyrosine kinase